MIVPATVIVPTRGRAALLRECVDSILAGDQLPAELVVVDQSDELDHALAGLGTVNGCRVIYRHTSSRGVSNARNEACALAGQDVLAFTDDDILVAPDWIATITRAVQAEADTTLISGRVQFIDSSVEGGFAPSLIDEAEPKLFEGRIWNDVLFSNNMAFARAVYDRLGPFDPRLGVGGRYLAATDNDYCFRALEAGYRIRYLPEAVVHHQAWRSTRSYAQVQWGYGVGQGATLMKHGRPRDRYTLLRLRNEFRKHLRIAARECDRGEAAFTLGLLYGSLKWLLFEKLRGR